jgi:hypothetical protein
MNNDSLVVSYLTLRQFIGVLGMSLPFILALGGQWLFGQELQRSLSHYYHTGMRDVFVGTLCAIGVFLLSYRGPEQKDSIAGNLACIFAIGLAFFPTSPEETPTSSDIAIGRVHLALATAFFLTLIYFSLFLFTKTDPTKTPTREKLIRNRVYRLCGYTMLASLGLLVIGLAVLPEEVLVRMKDLKPVFWVESIAVFAFGVSWFIKGEVLWKDAK